jgi:DNA-nicking Smr family endonuclease
MRVRPADRRGGGPGHPGDDGETGPLKRVPIEDAFDLHSFRPRDVASAVDEYLTAARRKGFREVRLIHGKGTGVRRAEVRKLLGARADVLEFFDAAPERGGTGATVVLLAPEPAAG